MKISMFPYIAAFAGMGMSLAGCANDDTNNNNDNKQPPVHEGDKVKPNIIVILVDDMGYSDLGCYGSEIETPNIDRLAANGIRFRTFYNSARSSPTRASLLTGLYPHQVGYGSLVTIPEYPNYQSYANENNVFIPEVLKNAGYFSVMTGKWHLGVNRVSPGSRDFDRSLNGAAGGFYYYNDATLNNNGRPTSETSLYLNDQLITFTDSRLPANWYSTDLWVEMGLKMIDEAVREEKPFFWYLAHNAPHFPLQAPPETIAKYRGRYSSGFDAIRNARFKRQQDMGFFLPTDKLTPRNPHPGNKKWENMSAGERDISDNRMAIYAATIDEIDKSTGKLLDYLEEKGILENTVILFLSDNGGNAETGFPGRWEGTNPSGGGVNSLVWLGAPWADVANTPYFLYKHHGHEGGCNTPLIIHYPAGIAQSLRGTIDKENFGHVIDIMPTILELTGATYPRNRNGATVPIYEGTSLLPALSGGKINRTAPIIVEHEGNKMLRDGDWKVVQEFELIEAPWRLYNMRNDPTEMNDLAGTNPEKLTEMVGKYKRWADWTGVESSHQFATQYFSVGNWYVPVRDYFQ